MATPTLTKHSLPGSLGDLLVDLRTGDRRTPRPAVVIMHGFKGFKDWGMFPGIADRLARAGFSVASFNVSGSGVDDSGDFTLTEQFGRNTYTAELNDLHRTIEAVGEGAPLDLPAPTSIGLLGHSRGGGMAVLEASRNKGIRALVTWAAIGSVDRWSDNAKASWRKRGFVNIQNTRTGQIIPLTTDILDDIERNGASLDIRAGAALVQVPWLIIHGEADESVAADDARALHQASAGKAELFTLPDAGHTFGATHPMKQVPSELEQVTAKTVAWFSRYLY